MNKLLCLFCCAWLWFACSSRKQSQQVPGENQSMELSSLPIDSLIGQPKSWEWLESKFNASIETQEKSFSAKGRMRMRKDSLIWISIKPDIAIFEVFRLLILPDSTQALDLLNKNYYFGANGDLSEAAGIPFELLQLQEAMLGRPFFTQKQESYQTGALGELLWAASNGAETMKESPDLILPGQFLSFESPGRIQQIILGQPQHQQRTDITIHSYTEQEGYLLPQELSLMSTAPNRRLTIRMDFSKYKLNEELSFPFTVPDSYPRKSIQEIQSKP
jgi:hypothetical protein